MLRWFQDWWCELMNPETYRKPGRAGTAIAMWSVGILGLLGAFLVLASLQSCSPGATAALTKVGHLLNAAQALHELAENVNDLQDTPAAGELLEEQLPQALEKLDAALGELCAVGGPLPADHKACVHYRAYKADG